MSFYIRLYKSLTPTQFDAVMRSGWRAFSAESPEQKIFYPKLRREYAEMIARVFNLPHYKAAYVVQFKVSAQFMARYEIQSVAYEEHNEYKIPIEELPLLNSNLIGNIEVVSSFAAQNDERQPPFEELSWCH
jgi:hypothetical protein